MTDSLQKYLAELLGTVEEALEMVACIYAAHVVARAWLPVRVEVRERGPQATVPG